MGQQREQYLHFLVTVLDITDVIDDEGIALVELLEFLLQDEFGLGPEESLDQQCTRSEVDSPALQAVRGVMSV